MLVLLHVDSAAELAWQRREGACELAESLRQTGYMQDQEQAAECPGDHGLAVVTAEWAPCTLLPAYEAEEAPSAAESAHLAERTLSMQMPKEAPTGHLSLVQNGGQGVEEMAGQGPSLAVDKVHALGTELCSKVSLCHRGG